MADTGRVAATVQRNSKENEEMRREIAFTIQWILYFVLAAEVAGAVGGGASWYTYILVSL